MNSLLSLIAVVGILVVAAMRESQKVKRTLRRRKKAPLLPKALTLLIVGAQVSELLKVVTQASVTSLVATLFLLAMVAAAQSGTENEWR